MTKAFMETAAGNPENQDRARIVESRVGLVLVVADGAGGQSGGAEAATQTVEYVHQNAHELCDPDACVTLLRRLDQAIAEGPRGGETTCAIAVLTRNQVYGASVGDSGVWLVSRDNFTDLTEKQCRKPFIGTGGAWPIPFAHDRKPGEYLLLATDGLLKYAPSDRIVATCRNHSPTEAARQLIELVRYQSGALPDDVTVILTGEES